MASERQLPSTSFLPFPSLPFPSPATPFFHGERQAMCGVALRKHPPPPSKAPLPAFSPSTVLPWGILPLHSETLACPARRVLPCRNPGLGRCRATAANRKGVYLISGTQGSSLRSQLNRMLPSIITTRPHPVPTPHSPLPTCQHLGKVAGCGGGKGRQSPAPSLIH